MDRFKFLSKQLDLIELEKDAEIEESKYFYIIFYLF